MRPTIPYGKAISLLQNDMPQFLTTLELALWGIEVYGVPPPRVGEREDFDAHYCNAVLLVLLLEEFVVPCPDTRPYWNRIAAVTQPRPRMEEA